MSCVKYSSLSSQNSDSFSFSLSRQSSEPNINSPQLTGAGGSREYNSLPQYGRLHGFLQKLSTNRRSSSKYKPREIPTKDEYDDSKDEFVTTRIVPSPSSVSPRRRRLFSGGRNYKYSRLKVKQRAMSENCLLSHHRSINLY